ncbi:hypothetical protein AB0D94_36955 [Streptomyces sp. NPDC048255]|uniref:hypothetical protein n=1 Tax=Streptomyces sp. NPDC048255 TaxID=3154713 RepID=UPI0033CC752A
MAKTAKALVTTGATAALLLGGLAVAQPAAAGALGASCQTWSKDARIGYAKCWNGGSSKHRVWITCKGISVGSGSINVSGTWYSSHYSLSEAKTSTATCPSGSYLTNVWVENLTQS